MFYDKNQTIHNPDSLRHMNAEAWIHGHDIQLQNNYVASEVRNGINVLEFEKDIAHGMLYLNVNERCEHLDFIFKHEGGVYTQYGFSSGSITLPMPTVYVMGRMEYRIENGKVYLYTSTLDLGSKHLQHVPLSNLFMSESGMGQILNEYLNNIEVTNMCPGETFNNYLNHEPSNSLEEAITKMINYMTPYLMANGNLDLDIFHGDRSNFKGLSIPRLIDRYYDSSITNSVTQYRAYWSLLHLALEHHTPQEIYDILYDNRDINVIKRELGVSIEQLRDYVNKNPHELTF